MEWMNKADAPSTLNILSMFATSSSDTWPAKLDTGDLSLTTIPQYPKITATEIYFP
jgi:hypothetical protein